MVRPSVVTIDRGRQEIGEHPLRSGDYQGSAVVHETQLAHAMGAAIARHVEPSDAPAESRSVHDALSRSLRSRASL